MVLELRMFSLLIWLVDIGVLSKSHWNGWMEALQEVSQWISIAVILLLNELTIEEHRVVDRNDFLVSLCKCLSKANPHAAKEGRPAHGTALATVWSQTQRIVGVPSLWNELLWLLPLSVVVVKSCKVHLDSVVGLHPQFANLGVLSED